MRTDSFFRKDFVKMAFISVDYWGSRFRLLVLIRADWIVTETSVVLIVDLKAHCDMAVYLPTEEVTDIHCNNVLRYAVKRAVRADQTNSCLCLVCSFVCCIKCCKMFYASEDKTE